VTVTGGNGGIGLAVAEACARAGADVALWGKDPEKNERARQYLADCGGRVVALQCDVSDEASVNAATVATVGTLGRIDTMVANAGILRMTPFLDMSLDEWRAIMAVNLDGVFLTLRAAVRHMVERAGGGALVAVSSLAAYDGSPGMEHYSASKAGVLAVIRSLAVELARYEIRCNALVPGWIETDMTATWRDDPAMANAVTRRTPVRRWGLANELGPAAVFLADPNHRFHTGDALIVDGGYSVS
jgi:NAD(P)-dependent dehydrogenase (short-subunit alcohol dehydrogenase family)